MIPVPSGVRIWIATRHNGSKPSAAPICMITDLRSRATWTDTPASMALMLVVIFDSAPSYVWPARDKLVKNLYGKLA